MDKVICIGKNYLEHAKELGDAIPEKPVLFLKPPSTILQTRDEILRPELPRKHGEVHHECEIVVRINAYGEITHVTIGLDMTLRTLQAQLKKAGHPWEISKTFKHSVILCNWIPIADFQDYLDETFEFYVDGVLRQKSCGNKMRLLPKDCISYAAEYFPLRDGDVIMTGTPEGVASVTAGQKSLLKWGPIHQNLIWS